MNIVRLLNYSVEGNKYCVFSVMPLYAINFCYFFLFVLFAILIKHAAIFFWSLYK